MFFGTDTLRTPYGSRYAELEDSPPSASTLQASGHEQAEADPASRFSVLVNSRFFRHAAPQDSTLKITDHEGGRLQTLMLDGVEITLPEHPDEFGDWRAVLDAITGTPVAVETKSIREGCSAASIIPLGIDDGSRQVVVTTPAAITAPVRPTQHKTLRVRNQTEDDMSETTFRTGTNRHSGPLTVKNRN